jgi:alpha-galactosidase
VSGGPLTVAGQTYPAGIGTHANSLITYALPPGYARLRTGVGLDKAAAGQNTGGTVQFLVFTKSPLLPAPADSVRVPVALQELGLAGGATVQDVWTGRRVGVFSQQFAPYIRRHGAGFYRLSARKASQ